jgi:hypothetical protein
LADVAQLVEQLIRNQQVIGSSPIVGSIQLLPQSTNLLEGLDTAEHWSGVALQPSEKAESSADFFGRRF